jgi:general secretion pathway protein H
LRDEAGFTIVETLVALVLVAVLATLAAGYLRAPPAGAMIDAETARMAALLQRARAEAFASQRESRVVVDGRSRTYGIAGATARQLPADMSLSAELAATGVQQAGIIRFFPVGTASGGVIRLSLRGAEGTVRVNWATGAISIERPDR